MNHSSEIRMTNDEIRRNDEIRKTKPATAQLRGFRHSGFGFLLSFVIRHSSFDDLCNSGSWFQCLLNPKGEPGVYSAVLGLLSPARKSTLALSSGVKYRSGLRIWTFTCKVPFCRLASGAISAT